MVLWGSRYSIDTRSRPWRHRASSDGQAVVNQVDWLETLKRRVEMTVCRPFMNLHSTSHPSLKTHIAKGAPPKKGSLAPFSLAGRRSNVWTTLDHTWQLSKHKLILRMRNHVKNDQDTQCVLFLEPKHRVAPLVCDILKKHGEVLAYPHSPCLRCRHCQLPGS